MVRDSDNRTAPPARRGAASEGTAVALSTPAGEGGLAVVRVTGHDALPVARAVFPAWRATEPPSHVAVHGVVVWPAPPACDHAPPAGVAPGQELDTVVALPFLAPRSYTGEDVVEFSCHGGRLAAHLVVEACLAAGAIPAGPGEFTRRAFLNGKLSLDQAEAVADLIQAEDTLAATAAVAQLRGGLDRELQALEEPLLKLQAELEGSLEFVAEEGLATTDPAQLLASLDAALARGEGLLALAPSGRRLRDGVQVVLVGPPNVGKSTLFNALLGEERVLVDAEAGTTRDVVTARRERDGLRYHLHDTAGLREGGGRVEQMGMDRTRAAAADADIVLELVEAGAYSVKNVLAEAAARAGGTDTVATVEGGRAGAVDTLCVLTKADLLDADQRARLVEDAGHHVTSARDGEGVDDLWTAIGRAAETARLSEAIALGVVLNRRHQHRLERSCAELAALRTAVASEQPGDEVVATWLGTILGELGQISGRVYTEKMLGEVFGRFCVGK